MGYTYQVFRGEARRSNGAETHKVLFKDVIDVLTLTPVGAKVRKQAAADRKRQLNILYSAVAISTSVVIGMAYRDRGQGIFWGEYITVWVFLTLFTALLACIIILWVAKRKLDKTLVELWLFENTKEIKAFFLEFMASINRNAQPLLAECNDDTLQEIFINYNLNRSTDLDDAFNIVGYYKINGGIAKVKIKIVFDDKYERALVTGYRISLD